MSEVDVGTSGSRWGRGCIENFPPDFIYLLLERRRNFLIRARRAVNKRTDNRAGPSGAGQGGLFVREARGLQMVRDVDLKEPKAADRVTGTQ
jgi:hypothetical protein